MSTSLYWTPPPVQPKQNCIGSLKYLLAKKLWGTDGSSGSYPETVDDKLIPFLEGIEAGNGSGDMARDARKLISAIEKYGKVEIIIT